MIRIAAITFASDSAITIARLRPSKAGGSALGRTTSWRGQCSNGWGWSSFSIIFVLLLFFLFFQYRVAQEPNRNREPEPSEPFFPKPKAEPEPPEPFSRNRNRNRPFLLNCTENKEKPVLQRNRRNRKPEPLEPFHPRTVTEPNRTEASLSILLFFGLLGVTPKSIHQYCATRSPANT